MADGLLHRTGALLAGFPTLGWYVAYLDFVPVLPVVWAVEAANAGRVSADVMNRKFSVWNWLLVVVGAVNLVLEVVYWIRPEWLPS